jgi:HD-GYP domain-containing protein (c-di-GMP phosphodiesterase class II)
MTLALLAPRVRNPLALLDVASRRHAERVADLAMQLALVSGWGHVRALALHRAALLHDLGKLAVSRELLERPGPLTAGEVALIREHPGMGVKLAGGHLDVRQQDWVRHHHERWDGEGYPDRLAGEAIPDGARLLSVADAFDAMTNARPYSRPRSITGALE